jgi:hypothetical protein
MEEPILQLLNLQLQHQLCRRLHRAFLNWGKIFFNSKNAQGSSMVRMVSFSRRKFFMMLLRQQLPEVT